MAATAQKVAVVGVFASRDRAEQALAELRRAGFKDDEIGMVARNTDGKAVRTDGTGDTYADEGALTGAAVGAGAGALVGLGVLAGVIPVIGPVLAVGTLGTILLNAAGGAAIAGLAGALVGMGIPEDEAGYYEGEVKAGRFLVTVSAASREDEARAILTRLGGYDRAPGRTDGAPAGAGRAAAELTEAGRTVRLSEEELRTHKQTVNAGEVEVRKEVRTEHQTFNVPVEREEVVIERRPAAGAAGDIRAEEIRIPVKEEKVNVTKEAVVKEEVNVGKRKVQGTETVSGDVRKEELVVETEGEAKVRRKDRK